MNATSLEDLRAGQTAKETSSPVDDRAAAGHSSDQKMEQNRQLLFGDKLEALDARQAAFEQKVLQRLDVLSQRLDALSRDVLADRRGAFDELARAMHDLGNRVRGI
jgi:hypothetical protein